MARRTGSDAPKTVDDLVRVSGLGKDLVKAAMCSGELPGYRVGTRYLCPAEAFDDFLHGRWKPIPRPVLAEPATPLPQPTDLIRSMKKESA